MARKKGITASATVFGERGGKGGDTRYRAGVWGGGALIGCLNYPFNHRPGIPFETELSVEE